MMTITGAYRRLDSMEPTRYQIFLHNKWRYVTENLWRAWTKTPKRLDGSTWHGPKVY